ncbi:class I SAM-dependent RNA methyltransferase [Bacillus carboniphilus]|uniref:Class I SAM-dependent RNA methyltransferase n=1 Tax=Bacillus carboniphilus TaxID=86663 RepID=A0ABY9JWB8_9BACI|nr:class I SAM-dependent RNA methyltransferase [Bacillus carboniphilus]WLR43692.1 class I SAM-dependent RNA methyltransferase [Bacillus carboniphilus]
MNKFKIIATCAMGLEAIVAKEVRALGYDCQVDNGKVIVQGDQKAIVRMNLWLRCADRIKVEIGQFSALSFDELFERTKELPWELYIGTNGKFPVIGKSVKSQLSSVPDCQRIVKKAIVERIKLYRSEGADWVEESGPTYPIEVALLKDKATILMDTSGSGLHKRGFRLDQGEAPIKETLAAALVQLTNWTPDKPFIDPCCGSGTIVLEAALIGQNIAPGFNREFISEQWQWMDQGIWNESRQEVEDLANYDQPLQIIGSDIDHKMIQIAKGNAQEAGFSDLISFKQMQLKDLRVNTLNGVIVTNPPYGERLGDKPEVEQLYRDMGEVFSPLDTWSIYILTSHPHFEQLYGKKATKKRKLFNGFIKTDYYQFWGNKK